MKHLNADSIFKLFDTTDEEMKEKAELLQAKEADAVLIMTVVKCVEAYWLLDSIYTKKKNETYKIYKDYIQERYFEKTFNYLERISLSNIEPFIDVVRDLGYGTVLTSLNDLMEFYIIKEEYEKCAQIKKVIDTVTKYCEIFQEN